MQHNPAFSIWRFWPIRIICALAVAVAIRLVVAILDGSGVPVVVSRGTGLGLAIAALAGLGRVGWVQPAINGLQPPTPGRGLILGAVAGALLYGGIVLLAALAGWYSVQRTSLALGPFLAAFALLLLAGAFEEVLFRGVLFQVLERAIGTGWALALSGALFGALHLGNANATWVGALAIGLAGVALAAAFAWTRDLWLLTGVHVMWNVTQGPVFGVAVSGIAFRGLIEPSIRGPEFFTGGAFGFEASGITMALALALAVWLVQRTKIAGRWQRASGPVLT